MNCPIGQEAYARELSVWSFCFEFWSFEPGVLLNDNFDLRPTLMKLMKEKKLWIQMHYFVKWCDKVDLNVVDKIRSRNIILRSTFYSLQEDQLHNDTVNTMNNDQYLSIWWTWVKIIRAIGKCAQFSFSLYQIERNETVVGSVRYVNSQVTSQFGNLQPFKCPWSRSTQIEKWWCKRNNNFPNNFYKIFNSHFPHERCVSFERRDIYFYQHIHILSYIILSFINVFQFIFSSQTLLFIH